VRPVSFIAQSRAEKRIEGITLVLETTDECSFLFAQTKRPGLRLSRSKDVERPSPMAKTVQPHITLCVKTDEWLGRAQTCTTGVLGPPTHQCHSFTAEIELPFARLAVPERMFLCCGGI